MRVLHVDHAPLLGGAERSVLELARAQREAGDDATVAVGSSGSFSEALAEAGIPAIDLDWSLRYTGTATERSGLAHLLATLPDVARAVHRLRGAIERLRPDVVHAHTRKGQLVASLALMGRRERLVWHLRDDVPTRGLVRALLRIALRRADHAVALTEWLAEHHRRCRLLPRSRKIGIVPSGIDPAGLSTLPTPWLDGAAGPFVGYVGQIAEWKAPHLLVEAAEALADHPGVRYRIVGDVWFPAAEAAYGRRLKERIAASPVADRIEWLATRTPVEAFAALDILVHCSTRPEPFGRVLVEAMAARRPVVAFEFGAAGELVDASVGWPTATPTSSAIADSLRALLSSRAEAADRVARALERSASFRPSVVRDRMAEEYAVVAR